MSLLGVKAYILAKLRFFEFDHHCVGEPAIVSKVLLK